MSPKEQNYENLAEGIIEKLAHRNMEGYYCKDREEANCKSKAFSNTRLFDIMGRFGNNKRNWAVR